ncbi:MAG: glycosyltransferase family 4 protein [Eggerthellaceae bacterium]|nr:glycosyltransferase family 4 protein [Eggerthellaceae bacterium]
MRILSVTAQKPDSTGSGVYLAQLVRVFDGMGHEQAVVCGSAPLDSPEDSLPSGVSVYPVRFETSGLPFKIAGMSDDMPYPSTRYCDFDSSMLNAFKKSFESIAMKAIDEFKPDLIICHHLYLVTSVIAHLPRRCLTVGICHGTCLRQMRKHDLDAEFIREGVRSLDGIMALTSVQVEDIVDVIGLGDARSLPPISVIGTGYDSSLYRWPSAPKPSTRELLYVGKIAEQKGVASLLRALDLLPWCRGQLQVRLVGGGAEEHPCIARSAAESRYDVDMTGTIPPDRLARLYQQAHVFVLPSFYEGLPLVLAEALACGCVLVCTDLPGVKEWLLSAVPDAPALFVAPPRMHGVDVPYQQDLPAFEESLASAIVQAFSASEYLYGESAASAPCSSVKTLSWDSVGNCVLDVCRRLLK